jgi:hypothetical protein
VRPRRSKEALNLAKRWIQIAAIRIRLCSVSVVVVAKDEKAKRKEKQNRSGKFEHRSGSAEEIFEEFWNCGFSLCFSTQLFGIQALELQWCSHSLFRLVSL